MCFDGLPLKHYAHLTRPAQLLQSYQRTDFQGRVACSLAHDCVVEVSCPRVLRLLGPSQSLQQQCHLYVRLVLHVLLEPSQGFAISGEPASHRQW